MIVAFPPTYKRFSPPIRRANSSPAPVLTALERLSLTDLETLIAASMILLMSHGLATASDVALLDELGAAL